MRNERGYQPMTLPPALIAVLPPALRKQYGQVQKQQERWRQERDQISVLRADAREAPRRDEQAAREAVANGQPVPAPTVKDAELAADQQTRQVAALVDLLDAEERSLLAGIVAVQPDLSASLRDLLADRVTAASHALADYQQAIADVGILGGLWRWARSGDYSVPAGRPMRLTVDLGGYSQEAGALVGTVGSLVDRQHPDAVEQAEKDRALLIQQQQGQRLTPDGVLLDHGVRYGG